MLGDILFFIFSLCWAAGVIGLFSVVIRGVLEYPSVENVSLVLLLFPIMCFAVMLPVGAAGYQLLVEVYKYV